MLGFTKCRGSKTVSVFKCLASGCVFEHVPSVCGFTVLRAYTSLVGKPCSCWLIARAQFCCPDQGFLSFPLAIGGVFRQFSTLHLFLLDCQVLNQCKEHTDPYPADYFGAAGQPHFVAEKFSSCSWNPHVWLFVGRTSNRVSQHPAAGMTSGMAAGNSSRSSGACAQGAGARADDPSARSGPPLPRSQAFCLVDPVQYDKSYASWLCSIIFCAVPDPSSKLVYYPN